MLCETKTRNGQTSDGTVKMPLTISAEMNIDSTTYDAADFHYKISTQEEVETTLGYSVAVEMLANGLWAK